MMQKSLAFATVLGAVIVAAALVYHGRQLSEVSRRLDAMEQRTGGLDVRLEKFSSELPTMVEQAGNNAGRQAVRGIVDEVVQMPLGLLRARPVSFGTNTLRKTTSGGESSGTVLDQGAPWVRFDISQPVIKIEILPNLKEVPAVPWPTAESSKESSSQTNTADGTAVSSAPDSKTK